MRATIFHGPGDIRVETIPDPAVERPTDAVVRVTAACVCGSDLWPYRGVTTRAGGPIGHEAVGIVEEVGGEVTRIRPGQFVVVPFVISDGTCEHCRNGITPSCANGGFWGGEIDGLKVGGTQAQWVRVPLADGTLVPTPEVPDDALLPGLLALADVMATGHHAAVCGAVCPGATVVVVGDGAVGLCAVLASRRLGAERIVLMSRHTDRQALGRRFGATDVVAMRGAEGVAEVRALLGDRGADCALECVGMKESMEQAIDIVRPGGTVGSVGAPNGGPELPIRKLFFDNITIAGGVAPPQAYLPELLPDVLSGAIEPGLIFDLQLPIDDAAEAYAAMDERRAIKSLLQP